LIGVILIAHARLASETKAAVEYILREQVAFEAIDVTNSDEAITQTQAFSDVLKIMLTQCDGVLVMVDIFGATPCNIAMNRIVQADKCANIEMIAGFNLPCVIKTMLERKHASLEDLARLSLDSGQKYMRLGSQEHVVQQIFSKRRAT